MSPDALPLTVTTLLGLAFGSFFNVCIHRVPRGQSVWHPGSRCPGCGYALRWYDNIPVLSYAILGARCRKCHAFISLRYPIVELATCGLFVLHYFVFGWTPLFVVRLAFASALLVLFAIDLEHQILPDVITLPGILIGLAAAAWLPPGLRSALFGMIVGGGVLFLIGEAWSYLRKVEAMGFGDVKMLAMIGAFLGLKLTILTFVLSSYLGGIVGLLLVITRRVGLMGKVPFGTFLAVAALVASLWGDTIVNWYLSRYMPQVK